MSNTYWFRRRLGDVRSQKIFLREIQPWPLSVNERWTWFWLRPASMLNASIRCKSSLWATDWCWSLTLSSLCFPLKEWETFVASAIFADYLIRWRWLNSWWNEGRCKHDWLQSPLNLDCCYCFLTLHHHCENPSHQKSRESRPWYSEIQENSKWVTQSRIQLTFPFKSISDCPKRILVKCGLQDSMRPWESSKTRPLMLV